MKAASFRQKDNMRLASLLLFVAVPASAQNADVPSVQTTSAPVQGRLVRVETYDYAGRVVKIEEYTDAQAGAVVKTTAPAAPVYTLHNGYWWLDRGQGRENIGPAFQQYQRPAYSYYGSAGDCAGGG